MPCYELSIDRKIQGERGYALSLHKAGGWEQAQSLATNSLQVGKAIQCLELELSGGTSFDELLTELLLDVLLFRDEMENA